MSKIVLSDVNMVSTSAPVINSNSTLIEEAFNNTLSRDGSSPNQMEADLDMNDNDVLNVKNIDVESLTIQGQSVSDLIQASEDAIAAAAEAEEYRDDAEDSATEAAGYASTVYSQLANLPKWKGPWLTATAYVLGDEVQESGSSYICVVPHTSGTFSTDLSDVKWNLVAAKGAAGAGTGDLVSTNNLSDLSDIPTARSNLAVPSSSANSTINSHWTFNDNPSSSIRLGTDQDAKLFYDNTNGIVAFEAFNNALAQLKLRFPLIELMNKGGTETFAKFTENGAADLYYDNSKKLGTTSSGINVTGEIDGDSVAGDMVASLGSETDISSAVDTKIVTPYLAHLLFGSRFEFLQDNGAGKGYLKIVLNASTCFMIQWGTFSLGASAGASQTVSFYVPFNQGIINTLVSVNGSAAQMIGIANMTNSSVDIKKGGGDSAARSGRWLAIGLRDLSGIPAP